MSDELREIGMWMNWADECQNFVEAVDGLSREDAAQYLLRQCGDEMCALLPVGDTPREVLVHDHDEAESCKGEGCPRKRRVLAWEFEMYETGELSDEDRERAIALRALGGGERG